MHIIAIDGPVGSGKSTIAKMIAKKAGFAYLDTGAMYRAIGWKVYTRTPPPLNPLPQGEGKLNEQPSGEDAETIHPLPIPSPLTGEGPGGGGQGMLYPPLENGGKGGFDAQLSEESLNIICTTTRLEMELENSQLRVIVDGKDVSAEIRTPEISRMASAVSVFASVRKYLVRMQREIGQSWADKYGGVVVEGRDIGTVVFPDTPFKFYLDADINERGKRRWKELHDKGVNVSLEETIREVISRDENDKNREIDPLKKAEDAIVVDTTGLSIEEVVVNILSIIKHKSGTSKI